MVVNNMRANVDVLLYDDHDRAMKLLHSLDHTVWGGKFEAIVESQKYDTLTVNELFSKLKSPEVDRGMTTKIEGPTDSHSLSLISGSKGKSNSNPSTRMFSSSSLMPLQDEEFNVLREDELVLLTRRFERMHENWVNSRRNSRVCFKCDKTRHFYIECLKVNNHNKHKSKDKGRRSKKEHEHRRKTRTQEKIKRLSDVDSGSEDASSSSSEEEEEGDKKKKKKKDFGKYLNGLCFTASKTSRNYNKNDGLCGMAWSSSSRRCQKNASDSDSDSEDEVCDELSSLRKENNSWLTCLIILITCLKRLRSLGRSLEPCLKMLGLEWLS
jgi:hypothetical protein